MSAAEKNSSPFFAEDLSTTFINILMAVIVIQIAVITFWLTLAEDSNGDAGRDAQIFAMQGIGKRTVGSLRAGYNQTAAYNRWVELNTLAQVAAQRGDDAQAERLLTARDRIAKLSTALQPPYFDPTQDTAPNLAAFEANDFVRDSVALQERFENQYRLKKQYADQSSAYTVQLTMLAVALFVLGVAMGSKRRVRVLFMVIGAGIAVFVLVWMLVTYTMPVRGISDEAIDAYAAASAALYQGDDAKALADYDRAVLAAPDYRSAYVDRSYVKYLTDDFAGSAQDLERARALGDTSSETAGSLGFVYYLLGKFDQANALNQTAAQQAPNDLWIRFNYALGLLAAGQTERARQEYDNALQDATQTVANARAQKQEPPAGMWVEFDEGAQDLEALQACAAEQACEGAPPASTLQNAAAIATTAQQWATKLKEYSVALEYTSAAPPQSANAQVDELTFTREFSDDDEPINAADTFEATDEPIYVLIPLRNFQDGQKIVIKVYVNDVEDDRLRGVGEYSAQEMGGADGDVLWEITTGGVPLDAGAYHIEMYVDSKLVQTGDFVVE